MLAAFGLVAALTATTIGNHPARFTADGILKPWTSWRDALSKEMAWYRSCPKEGKYTRSVSVTFMDGSYHRVLARKDSIPAMQCATGIISYLAYDRWTHGRQPWLVDRASEYAAYILQDAHTPSDAEWPSFPRSTGRAGAAPQPVDCGSQADKPYEVQPDKGGLFGFALMQLWKRTGEASYREAATQIARTLVRHMSDGDAADSPWPFRVDFRTGAGRGVINADMCYPLALFAELAQSGLSEFREPQLRLWRWIKTYQLPSAKKDGKLWVAFFEDYDMAGNRNSWAATNLAQLLLTMRAKLDEDWLSDARTLIDYATRHFVTVRYGVPVCGEQDDDTDPWGGACSSYGAALALYAKAAKDPGYGALARQALNFVEYAIADDGCPGQTALYPVRGGWQEDAHTDVVRNFLTALDAYPEWADRTDR